MAHQGRRFSRKDLKDPVDSGSRKLQTISQEKWRERTHELVQLYNRLIMRQTK